MRIRWARGAFRAWVVFTGLWLGGAAWMHFGPKPPGPWDMFADIPAPRSVEACKEAAQRDAAVNAVACVENVLLQNWGETERLIWTFGPPLPLLIVGLGFFWVMRGFRSDEPRVEQG